MKRPLASALIALPACFALLAALGAPPAAAAEGAASAPAASPPRVRADDHRAELAQARAATDRRDFAAALPIYERLVLRAPADADLLIEAARVFGWADHNNRAAALYRQALAAAPGRRADIVPSLAWQTLWAGDAQTALPLFEEAMALRPGDGELVWGWGSALNDAGRHREALAAWQRLQHMPAAGSEARRLELARAWRWAGYEDRAWPWVQDATSAEGRWLRDFRIARDIAPYGYAALELTEDRDTLRGRAVSVGAGMRPMAGVNVEFGARRIELDDNFGDAAATTFEVSGRLRLGEPDSTAGTWWPQLALRAHHIGAWHPVAPILRLKWIPADRWRIDAERTRELVETPRAFAHRVTVDVSSLGTDWRPGVRLALAGSVARLHFDDGTTRERLGARAEWALVQRPRWVVGTEWSRFARTRDGAAGADDRGYWNPRRYEELRVVTGVTCEQRPWELQARGGFARSREVDSAGNTSRGAPNLWELALAWDRSPAWQLRASAGGSGQALGLASAGASGARYWRRWLTLAVNGWF